MKQNKMGRSPLVRIALSLICCATFALGQTPPQDPQLSTRDAATERASSAAATFDQVIDRSIEREHFFLAQMKNLHPLVETYLQNLKTDKELNALVPTSDVYFLGRLNMSS